jgi:hypothetical protein
LNIDRKRQFEYLKSDKERPNTPFPKPNIFAEIYSEGGSIIVNISNEFRAPDWQKHAASFWLFRRKIPQNLLTKIKVNGFSAQPPVTQERRISDAYLVSRDFVVEEPRLLYRGSKGSTIIFSTRPIDDPNQVLVERLPSPPNSILKI